MDGASLCEYQGLRTKVGARLRGQGARLWAEDGVARALKLCFQPALTEQAAGGEMGPRDRQAPESFTTWTKVPQAPFKVCIVGCTWRQAELLPLLADDQTIHPRGAIDHPVLAHTEE